MAVRTPMPRQSSSRWRASSSTPPAAASPSSSRSRCSRRATRRRSALDRRAAPRWSGRGGRTGGSSTHRCTCAWCVRVRRPEPAERRANWSHVVTSRRGVPAVPDELHVDGCLGDRAQLNANFRDEYYGMVPAVGDHATGPRLITSGLIDPAARGGETGRSRSRSSGTSAHESTSIALDDDMLRWARRRLVPKVLVANQTRIVEAVCDPAGEWLPAVPVLGVYPWARTGTTSVAGRPTNSSTSAWEIAAVLTSPVASAWLWHRGAGTGLSADSIRLSPVTLGELPWPAGDLGQAVAALRAGDVRGCGAAVARPTGSPTRRRCGWWSALLEGIEAASAVADGCGGRASPANRPPSTAARGRPVRSRGSVRRAVSVLR